MIYRISQDPIDRQTLPTFRVLIRLVPRDSYPSVPYPPLSLVLTNKQTRFMDSMALLFRDQNVGLQQVISRKVQFNVQINQVPAHHLGKVNIELG